MAPEREENGGEEGLKRIHHKFAARELEINKILTPYFIRCWSLPSPGSELTEAEITHMCSNLRVRSQS